MNVSKPHPGSSSPEIKFLELYSHWLDSRFRMPGTSIRFGLDPLIGLIPVAGQISTFIASSVLVLAMARHGASGEVIVRMMINILADSLIGSIPVLGNIADFFIKANDRNLRILKRHYHEGKYTGSGKGLVAAVVITLLAILVLMIFFLWKGIEWLWNYFI